MKYKNFNLKISDNFYKNHATFLENLYLDIDFCDYYYNDDYYDDKFKYFHDIYSNRGCIRYESFIDFGRVLNHENYYL